MKELWKEKGLWVAALLCFGGMAAGFPFYQIKMPLAAGSFLEFCETALESKVVLFSIPIAGVLPVGAVFVRESSSGFLRLYITRTNRMDYVKQKTMQIYGGGFVPFFIAGVGMVTLAFLFVYPLELRGDMDWERLHGVMERLLRISMLGGILGELSGIFGAASQNYYMAYGLPFVCYYMLVILKERYLPDLYTMYPAEWVARKGYWGSDGSGIWVFLAAFSVGGMLLHGLVLWRKVQEI